MAARDPLDTGWFPLAVGDAFAELSQGVAVIAVGLRVDVGSIDVANDVLGGCMVFEGVGEAAGVFGESGVVDEEVLVAVLPDSSLQEIHPVAEVEQEFGILGADVVGGLNPLSEALDLGPEVSRRHWSMYIGVNM